jgi:hypothetical protein
VLAHCVIAVRLTDSRTVPYRVGFCGVMETNTARREGFRWRRRRLRRSRISNPPILHWRHEMSFHGFFSSTLYTTKLLFYTLVLHASSTLQIDRILTTTFHYISIQSQSPFHARAIHPLPLPCNEPTQQTPQILTSPPQRQLHSYSLPHHHLHQMQFTSPSHPPVNGVCNYTGIPLKPVIPPSRPASA